MNHLNFSIKRKMIIFLITDNYAYYIMGFPDGSEYRVCLPCGRPGFDPWVRKIAWRRKWQPTPVFSPGKFHGQRSLVARVHGVTKS